MGGQVSWDTMVGFSGPKTNHICIPHYTSNVGVRDMGYNKVLESFQSDKISGFGRVIVVNPLHEKLP